MENATLVFTRLPNRKYASEQEVCDIFEPILSAYGPVFAGGSWIMTCGPLGTGHFHKFRVAFESINTLYDLIKLCEKSIAGFVGAVIRCDSRFNSYYPLTIVGSTNLYEMLDVLDYSDVPADTAIKSFFTADEVAEAHEELDELNDRIAKLECENRIMRAVLDIEDGENPINYSFD